MICNNCKKDHIKENISECWKLPCRELTNKEIEELKEIIKKEIGDELLR